MNSLARRVRRLQRQLEPPPAVGERGPSAADVLRERRRRRLEAEGLPPDEREPYLGGGAPLNCVEMLRLRFKRPDGPASRMRKLPWHSMGRRRPSGSPPHEAMRIGQGTLDFNCAEQPTRNGFPLPIWPHPS